MMNLPNGPNEPVRIACDASPGFQDWLAQAGGSVAITTYQAGKVALLGHDGRQVLMLMRQFDKPLGMAVRGNRIALATRHDLWLFADARPLAHDYLEDQPGRYDALYLPRTTYHTGDLNTHDLAFEGEGLVLVNTRFSCLARLSHDFNFAPLWRPKFVTDLVPEDRCHLNGLAMRDGRARYVTALGTTDVAGGWREKKASGGVLVDVTNDEIVLGGLSMPHSPRWHDGRLWVLNSGAGELLAVDPDRGQSEVVCSMAGYLRGLCFAGPYALVGLSKIREKHIFGGLPVQERYGELLCGVAVVDLRSGAEVGMFRYTSGCEELYDLQFLSGVSRPTILNLDKPAVREAMTDPVSSYWLRAGAEVVEEVGAGGVVRTELECGLPAPEAGGVRSVGNMLPDCGT